MYHKRIPHRHLDTRKFVQFICKMAPSSTDRRTHIARLTRFHESWMSSFVHQCPMVPAKLQPLLLIDNHTTQTNRQSYAKTICNHLSTCLVPHILQLNSQLNIETWKMKTIKKWTELVKVRDDGRINTEIRAEQTMLPTYYSTYCRSITMKIFRLSWIYT